MCEVSYPLFDTGHNYPETFSGYPAGRNAAVESGRLNHSGYSNESRSSGYESYPHHGTFLAGRSHANTPNRSITGNGYLGSTNSPVDSNDAIRNCNSSYTAHQSSQATSGNYRAPIGTLMEDAFFNPSPVGRNAPTMGSQSHGSGITRSAPAQLTESTPSRTALQPASTPGQANAQPVAPQPVTSSAQANTKVPTRSTALSHVRYCQGRRNTGRCKHKLPKTIWNPHSNRVRQCIDCLANPPPRDIRSGIDARVKAGHIPCSKCWRKDSRCGGRGGGLCDDCFRMGKENKDLRDNGNGKRQKKTAQRDDEDSGEDEPDDLIPRGGPGNGPPKGDKGGGGSGPAPHGGAVGTVLADSIQWAFWVTGWSSYAETVLARMGEWAQVQEALLRSTKERAERNLGKGGQWKRKKKTSEKKSIPPLSSTA